MAFKVRIGGIVYTVKFTTADDIECNPKPTEEAMEIIESLVWEMLVAPKGSNFRGRKVRRKR